MSARYDAVTDVDVTPFLARERSWPLLLEERRARPYVVRAVSRPATEYTGDFYLTFEIGDALWFAVGDFAGHGIDAVVFMAMVQEEIEARIRACSSSDPAEVVASLDAALRAVFPQNRFATLVIGRASADGSITLVNAGHCPPVLVRKNGEVEIICSHGPVVGLLPAMNWLQQSVRLERGERLFIYSDGLVEAEDSTGEEFGGTRLVARLGAFSPEEPLEEVVDSVERFAGGRRHDDMTIFLLQRS
jgi:serine phosphatase RsbU (regulator of sigma subunit)